jgi:putative copper resistance protein D
LINPLIVTRDIHLASTVIVAGIIFFDLFIASPVWQTKPSFHATHAGFQSSTSKILWTALALSIASAPAWLVLLSMRIGHKDLNEAFADGIVWRVLSQTQFGLAWQLRLLFSVLLAACLLLRRTASSVRLANGLGLLSGLFVAAYLGSLAFAGHGAEGLGFEQNVHLAADFLHLIAAGLWLGALIPLALLLVYLGRFREDGWVLAAARAGSRFSTLGILAVGILLVSGTINAAFLLGGMHNLIDTEYGRLLLLKITLFVAMVSLATVNRQHLLPRLWGTPGEDQASRTVQQLLRSTVTEMAAGLAIILIVGLLGIMAPAHQMAAHLH